MAARQSTPASEHSAHSDSNVRKRVCKACDRCRLKKSKCDGASPCSRCRADNAICVFGERKKAHDKVYPKGYVEMLEQQQAWLVNGLQALYRRALDGEGWTGEPLKVEPDGHPLTHDLLTQLGALDHNKGDQFEENVNSLQQRLWQQNTGAMQRQDSSDSNSDFANSPPGSQQRLSNSSQMAHHIKNSNNNHSRRHHPYPLSQYAETMTGHHMPPTPPGSFSPRQQLNHHQQHQHQQQQQQHQQQKLSPLQTIKSEPLETTCALSSSTIPTPTSSISTSSSSSNNNNSFHTLYSHQGAINPMALQQQQSPWTTTSPNNLSFDDLDMIDVSGNGSATQFQPFFEDIPTSSSPFMGNSCGRLQLQQQQQQQPPINCLPPSMLFESDDFSQFFNPSTEISTI